MGDWVTGTDPIPTWPTHLTHWSICQLW